MAVLSQLEYRLNFFTDAVIQPLITCFVEIAVWSAILASTASESLAGFGKDSYISYALWAAFFARTTANWMYEYRMIDDIESGSVNSILARPISFYEYYLGQFMGYKILTTFASFFVPIIVYFFFKGTTDIYRLPLALLLTFYYLFFVHTLSFAIASIAFFLNRVNSFTIAKNIALWVLTGEMFPLDLMPVAIKNVLIALPFSNGVYIPVGYLTGRLGLETVVQGFISTTLGLIVLSFLANRLWTSGRRAYSGTGA